METDPMIDIRIDAMTSSSAFCRALLISAPASGQGKTTVTAALARQASQQGLAVRVFKTGPDFIDPMLLARASGAPVHTLDLWMSGEAHCRALLYEAAAESDLILIEGVMGLYDGAPSTADLARLFQIPVVAVIDGSAMANTFGAVALGLACYQTEVPFHGVIGNRVGSTWHAALLEQSLAPPLHWLGALPCDAQYALPERHLGLVQAAEIVDVESRIEAAASSLGKSVDFEAIPRVGFAATGPRTLPPRLAGQRIAIARDAAFSFIYEGNLDCLRALGAELLFFSPLADSALPECDAVYLPGGYPELHAAPWSANTAMHDALRAHHAASKPMLAECGGMMALMETLTDLEGTIHGMAGLLSGGTCMQPNLQAIGMQSVDLGHGELRGHSFHYSRLHTVIAPDHQARHQNGRAGEGIHARAGLTASYLHFYFPSNPEAAARLFLR